MAGRGRPREFSLDQALDAAVEVFWRQGYEGTTLRDLTSSMGISRPSLYAAFGDKEQTFERAVGRYSATRMSYLDEALAEPTAKKVAAHYLRSNVEAITTPSCPPGCLSVQGGLAAGEQSRPAVEFLAKSRAAAEKRLSDRFQSAIDSGDLPAHESAEELACLLVATTGGLAVEASTGVSREKLSSVAERVLRLFD